MTTTKTNNIVSFANLVWHPMQVPNTGCIATGKLSSGLDITVTGGNTGQAADGHETFLVEVVDSRSKEPKTITKKNMSRDDLTFLIEHHHKNRFRKPRRYR